MVHRQPCLYLLRCSDMNAVADAVITGSAVNDHFGYFRFPVQAM